MSGPTNSQCTAERPRRGWLLTLSAIVGFVLAATVCDLYRSELRAQNAVMVAPMKSPGGNVSLDRGFSLVFDDRLADSLTKFEEQVKARTWEKAFRILSDVPEDKWSSMLPSPSGFVRPASQRVRDTILELPADGREAYRIFFDAKARLLFDSARTAQKEEDVKIARSVYDRYFLTSVGDDAADRLADDYYERGQFVEAARCWKSIFDFHPDTNLSEVKLHLKWAIALFRAGQLEDFTNASQELERNFPGARVVLGGKEVVAADYLKGLQAEYVKELQVDAKQPPRGSAPTTIAAPSEFAGLAPTAGTEPAWRHRFLEDSDWAAVQASVRNYYGAPALPAIIPAAATDGQRVYCNWLGACFAIDVASGKMAWKSSPDPKSIAARLRLNDGRAMFYTTNMAQFSLALGKGVVLCLASSNSQYGQNNPFRLIAYDAATGRSLWTSERGKTGLGRWSFIGTPLVEGDSILAVTHQAGASNELVLRQLDLHSGNEIWALPLGTPQLVGESDWGQQSLPIPALARSGSRLYILTNDGALLAVDVARRRIEWAFKYDAPSNAGGNGRRFVRMGGGDKHAHPTRPLIVRDGVIYFKESGSPVLYAIEESGPREKWRWSDSDSANLVGIDEKSVYLFSDELSAIDRLGAKPKLNWSHLLPVDTQGIGPAVGRDAVLVFTSRGLFEISKQGENRREVFRGADLGVAGGIVLSAGKRVVCVSNIAVTAYPEPSAP